MITFSPGTIFFFASLAVLFFAYRMTHKPQLAVVAVLVAVALGVGIGIDALAG